MSVPLIATHASPFGGVPRRARGERHGYEPIRTPVEVRRESASAFVALDKPEVPCATYHQTLHLYEGSTWQVLGDRGPFSPPAHTPDAFLAFLRDGRLPDAGAGRALHDELRMTPVAPGAIRPSEGVPKGGHLVYGSLVPGADALHLDPGGMGRIVHEERERSARTLAAWLASDVRLLDDRVMVRRALLAEVKDWAGDTEVYLDTTYGLSLYGRIPVRPDRARELHAAHPYGSRFKEGEDIAAVEGFVRGIVADDDLVRLANHLPHLVNAAALVDAGTAQYVRRVVDPALAAATFAGLRPWLLRGGIGGVGLDEAGDVLALCSDSARDFATAGIRLNTNLKDRLHEVETSFLPRLHEIAPEDADALSAMAP
jgi:hypothetical protein